MEVIQECRPPNVPIHFQLLEIWTRLLGRPPENIDESFFDLGGHSLLLASMMEEVERATGRYVSIVQFLENPTIRHLGECLVAETCDDVITLVQEGRDELTPLFYFHGDVLGGGFYTRQLAPQLGADQPVYAIAPGQFDGEAIPTIEEMARQCVAAIRRRRPHGPYIFGGFCVGALTAYEVARQLTEQGEEVPGILLINPQLASGVLRAQLRVVQERARRRGHDALTALEQFTRSRRKIEQLRAVWNAPWRDKTDFVLRQSRKLMSGSAVAGNSTADDSATPATHSEKEWLLSAFEWIVTAHVPGRCERPVTVFLTEDLERELPSLARKWHRAAPNLIVERIPGKHLTCITTFATFLAAKLRVQLVKLQCGLSMFFSFPLLAAW
jgi:thioesterase domain-containing protein